MLFAAGTPAAPSAPSLSPVDAGHTVPSLVSSLPGGVFLPPMADTGSTADVPSQRTAASLPGAEPAGDTPAGAAGAVGSEAAAGDGMLPVADADNGPSGPPGIGRPATGDGTAVAEPPARRTTAGDRTRALQVLTLVPEAVARGRAEGVSTASAKGLAAAAASPSPLVSRAAAFSLARFPERRLPLDFPCPSSGPPCWVDGEGGVPPTGCR